MLRILRDTAIIVAVITVLGTLITALATEWYRAYLARHTDKGE